MEIQDLRIGNLIYEYRPEGMEIIQIESISKFFINGIGVSSIEPIPLTEEWLLKFGYKKNEDNFFVFGHLVWKCNDMFMCDKNGIALKHVHQLQNLYFALTGCELEIK